MHLFNIHENCKARIVKIDCSRFSLGTELYILYSQRRASCKIWQKYGTKIW